MSDDIAIKVDHVSKTFKLPHEKQTSIKGALINKFRRGKRTFERQEVLNDVSFEIKKGEFFGIVGRNGSGKSTLLKMLAGIYSPNAGAITVNGKLTPFIELGVGFNPELTGRENVFLNGALLGFNRSEMLNMYGDIVDFAELEQFMDQKLKNYSSGMQVRLAFSIAIRAQSDILLIDEVLAVGDAAFQQKSIKVFEEIKKSGRTVVFVSHDMAAVRQFCDRAVLINKGKKIAEGDPYQISAEYTSLNQPAGTILTDHSTGKISSIKTHSKQSNYRVTDHLTLTVGYDLKVDTDAIVGLSLIKDDNTYVAGFNNLLQKRNFSIGHNEATCTIPLGQLLPGSYFVKCSLYDTNFDLIDYSSDAYSFQIRGEKDLSKDGTFNIECDWRSI